MPERRKNDSRRRRLRLLISAGILLAILVASILLYRASLPTYSGTETVSGIQAPVEILRDSHAIPHIFAKSPTDAAFAMGYTHAQDRLWQMEIQRRVGAARLAEIVGERAVESDRFIRTLGLYRVAQRNFENLPSDIRQIYEAYAAGVNAFLESGRGILPPEFHLFAHKPEPWKPADSLVWLKIMAWTLGDNYREELLRARLAGEPGLGLEQLQDLWAQRPDDPAPGPFPETTTFNIDIDLKALTAASPGGRAIGFGSNSWVLSGQRTQSGKPLLANDPHLMLNVPGFWYLAHLDTPDFEVMGATLPGLPFPLLGQTRSFAWGFTNTAPDVQDIFIERTDPNDPTHYQSPTGSLPFETRSEIIHVRGKEPIEFTVRTTRHGPVISDVIDEELDFVKSGQVLSFAWTALSEEDTSGKAVVLAPTAQSTKSFVQAMQNLIAPQMTALFADREGNIGFITPGRVPIRGRGRGHLPAPGWTGTHDWVGYIPFNRLPDADNPSSGQIISANHRITPPGYPYYITDDWAPPFRAKRIDYLLNRQDKHAVGSFSAIQQDIVSPGAARLLPVLLERVSPTTPEEQAVLDRLSDWDFSMGRNRSEPLIYMAWLRELTRALFADELAEVFEDWWDIRVEVIHRALTQRQAWCDNIVSEEAESCSDQVTGSLQTALAFIHERYGPDMTGWRWGEAHGVLMSNRFLGRIPLIGSWFDIRMSTGGERETVNAGGFDITNDENPFTQNHGAGYRAVYDLANPERSVFITNTGQSGNPLSPHYRDFATDWRDGKYRTMLRDRSQALDNALGSLVLIPR